MGESSDSETYLFDLYKTVGEMFVMLTRQLVFYLWNIYNIFGTLLRKFLKENKSIYEISHKDRGQNKKW